MANDLAGRAAIVTGAASGIGAAVSRELAEGGAKVLVADLDSGAAGAMAAKLRGSGAEAASFAVDVADAEQVEAMVRHAVECFGGLHLAVSNAGSGVDLSLEGWRRVIDVNLNGVFYAMKYRIAVMLELGGGEACA